MQKYHRVHVCLGRRDQRQIASMLGRGRESARVLRRALILWQLNQGQKAAQAGRNVGMAPKTVRAIARRYEEEGLESALHEKPRPGKQRALDSRQSQRIIAMVCGPPAGGAGTLDSATDCRRGGEAKTDAGSGTGNHPRPASKS